MSSPVPTGSSIPGEEPTHPGSTPGGPHDIPGAGATASPGGGTTWAPSGTPTGTKPPGWELIHSRLVDAFMRQPNFTLASLDDDSILAMLERLSDKLIARYPKLFASQ